MATTEVVSNQRSPLGTVLTDALSDANEFKAAVAFLNSNGLDSLRDGIEGILEREGSVQLVHGADFHVTDPEAVHYLVALRERCAMFHYYVHCGWMPTHRQRFHPKLYIATTAEDRCMAVVGSSNLTHSGLTDNVEVNSIIRGRLAEAQLQRCSDIFDSMVRDEALVEPSLAFAERYQEVWERVSAAEQDVPVPVREFIAEFQPAPPLDATHWVPRTQLDVVIRAMQILQSNAGRDTAGPHGRAWPLGRIYALSEMVARANGLNYDWGTFDNSIRGRINTNKDTLGGRYFEGVQRGLYRLTPAGSRYGRAGQPGVGRPTAK